MSSDQKWYAVTVRVCVPASGPDEAMDLARELLALRLGDGNQPLVLECDLMNFAGTKP